METKGVCGLHTNIFPNTFKGDNEKKFRHMLGEKQVKNRLFLETFKYRVQHFVQETVFWAYT